MCVTHSQDVRRRPGFTLVELLVVLTLMLVLATIAVTFVPRVNEDQKATRGADVFQGWLLIAKQRALRDRIPTGLRLTVEGTPPNLFARTLQYVQQPTPFYIQGTTIQSDSSTYLPIYVYTNTAGGYTAPDYTGGASAMFGVGPEQYPVQPGDYLEVNGGLTHQIAAVELTATSPGLSPPPPASAIPAPQRLRLVTALVDDIAPTSNYRIVRQPRPLGGEPPLQLPQDVIIDLSPNPAFGGAFYSQNVPKRTIFSGAPPVYEIIFAPSGEVIGKGSGNDKIILWVRDSAQDGVNQGPPLVLPGKPALVTIHNRTGLIAAHPVDPTPDSTGKNFADPYRFTHDGQSSGF